jgi:acetoin utilization protein AcuC
MKQPVYLIHSDEYKNWIFDPTHPTQGRRFNNARDHLITSAKKEGIDVVEVLPRPATEAELLRVHTPAYIDEVLNQHISTEWDGERPDLASLASLFVGGTLTALDALLTGKTKLAIHFPGAKHHAQSDHSSGFCIFNDFAIAATKATKEYDQRVAIFDCDAHHGDGTEMLLKKNKNVMTYSVHEYGIFPGTGLMSDWKHRAYNFPLASKSGDEALLSATEGFLQACDEFQPTMIFVACGADALKNDPLSSLEFTKEGYFESMRMIREQYFDHPILLGGAGGYQPDTETPDLWATVALGLMAVQTEVVKP